MALAGDNTCLWLRNGEEAFSAMLRAIKHSTKSIRLETYIYRDCPLGQRFLNEMVEASRRGVDVNVLIDAFGSFELPDSFWTPLRNAGGKVRWFNPLSFSRFIFRDHRKILVCDEKVTFVGGFNIATEYEGDGVNRGWCDHGLQLTGDISREFVSAFDDMFERAETPHKLFARLRFSEARKMVSRPPFTLIFSGPGRGGNLLKRWLIKDLKRARDVRIENAYFLPTWRIRRELSRVVKRGGRVQLILPGKSDVQVAKLAARSLYHKLLRNGIEIYEYQPQILHSKLIIIDGIVYIGSANLDLRSLQIDYEVTVRIQNHSVAAEARRIFSEDIKHSSRIELENWTRARSFLDKLREKWSYFLLARLDTFVARQQIRCILKEESISESTEVS